MTLVELLGVMVVIIILSTITIGSVMKATERSRVTKAQTALDGYRSAFMDVCIDHPSVLADRWDAWGDGADNTSYSTKSGFERVKDYINDIVDADLHFYWDSEHKYYKTEGKDPWGGYYILTEYPQPPVDLSFAEADYPGVKDVFPEMNDTRTPYPVTRPDYYNCSTFPGNTYLACSIWAVGNSDTLTNNYADENIVADDSYGVCLTFCDGVVTPVWNGFNDVSPFEGWTITYK